MSDAAIAAAGSTPVPSSFHAWKDAKGFSFRDVLDIINPLQHLPIIGSIYRWATGDRPGEAAQVAGDALYGGPIGVGISLASAFLQDSKGHDVGEQVISALFGPSDAKTIAVASATPVPAIAGPAPAAAASATIALPQAKPDHPPIPLFGGIATPVPGAQPAAAPQNTAARDFLAHNAVLERQVATGTRYAPGTTAPVPLVLPPGSLQPPRLVAAPANTPANIPVDVSKKMMDGLDKYMKLEQERKTQAPSGTPPPPSVDLSL